MIRRNGQWQWGFFTVWVTLVFFCVLANVAFGYMLWKLGWAAIAWLQAH